MEEGGRGGRRGREVGREREERRGLREKGQMEEEEGKGRMKKGRGKRRGKEGGGGRRGGGKGRRKEGEEGGGGEGLTQIRQGFLFPFPSAASLAQGRGGRRLQSHTCSLSTKQVPLSWEGQEGKEEGGRRE